MRGACSANRTNSGVAVGVQFEGNSSEEEVNVLCEGAVNGGSSGVRNVACEFCKFCFLDDTHRNAAIQTLELCQALSHTHEKKLRV